MVLDPAAGGASKRRCSSFKSRNMFSSRGQSIRCGVAASFTSSTFAAICCPPFTNSSTFLSKESILSPTKTLLVDSMDCKMRTCPSCSSAFMALISPCVRVSMCAVHISPLRSTAFRPLSTSAFSVLSMLSIFSIACSCPEASMFHILCKSYCTPSNSFLLTSPGVIRRRPSMNSCTETLPLSSRSTKKKSSLMSNEQSCKRLISFWTSLLFCIPFSSSSRESCSSWSSSIVLKSLSRRFTTAARSSSISSARFFGNTTMMLSTTTAVTRFRSPKFAKRMKNTRDKATSFPMCPSKCMKYRMGSLKSSNVAIVNNVSMASENDPNSSCVKSSFWKRSEWLT
mmetsp:Transcript_160844/g.308926  ORF Transcript_160844/g.308926 Transcript_160844/m.308926 type:complete len:341 (+) Transcript_160844:770-1792(+)